MESQPTTTIILVAILLLAAVLLFLQLQKPPARKPGLFEQIGGFADGLGLGSLF